ncbi:DUF3168 domain-containing protein [Lentilitoribacter sp. Alg239-R112]|uniref:DUF3168 domain-containing protein n=1 Tax=Lentilitoribacter sp. Alg239-R112 TaxID=2305987 RepID=UPI0013A6F0E6|nr:DUF3168 domain-containing protein [Lentilitoribacter sp. Alg239-R112]
MAMMAGYLQKAIFQALNSENAITALIGVDNIFDHEIKDAIYPYISIDNWETFDWSTDSEFGEEHLFDVLIYEDKPARENLQNIAQKVVSALHDQPLTLDVGALINLRFESASFAEEGRNKLQIARLKFRAKIEYNT